MTLIKDSVYSVILAGGSGTRLWPLSNKTLPKQYLSFLPSHKTFLQLTIERSQKISRPENQIIVTTKAQEEICSTYLKDYNFQGKVITEPAPRNTTAAIALVAYHLMNENPESFMVVLPSDHYIQNSDLFASTIHDALELAQKNYFVVIGIDPSHSATEFGYIKIGDALPVGFDVISFHEKPDYTTAEKFLSSKEYLWNAGIFIWKTKTFWEKFSLVQPNIAQQVQSMNEDNQNEVYQHIENIPIDISFFEKTDQIACVKSKFDWNDIGSWSAIRECFSQDTLGNSIHGNVHAMDIKNCIIHSTEQFVSVIGLENIGVVATKDAILVTNLKYAQQVKKMATLFDKSLNNT